MKPDKPMTESLRRALEAYDRRKPEVGQIPGESLQELMMRGMGWFFGRSSLEHQNEDDLRRHIKRGNFSHAIKLLKAWHARAPEEIDILRQLKAELQAARTALRAKRAEACRRTRKNRRARAMAADTRTCPVCQGPMKGHRVDAVVCSTRCRMRKSRLKSQPVTAIRIPANVQA